MSPLTKLPSTYWCRLISSTTLLIATCHGLHASAQTKLINTFPVEAQSLSPLTLQERLAGKRFTSRYANGMTATINYGADQALQLEMSTGLSAQGTWRVNGSQICMQFQAVAPSGCSEF